MTNLTPTGARSLLGALSSAPGELVPPADPGAFSGLVISAISRPSDCAPENGNPLAAMFKFPDASMVSAAAAMFPALPGGGTTSTGWVTQPGSGEVLRTRVEGTKAWRERYVGGEWHEYRERSEGPATRVDIAPGMVRISRADINRQELAAERAREAAQLRDDFEYRQMSGPMALAIMGGSDPVRGEIVTWSKKSQARMVSTIASLDLADFVSAGMPGIVTLTAPGDWLSVFPDAKTAARKFDNFCRAWAKKWGPLRGLWKREFQNRGAPHWHIWTVPPGDNLAEFMEWLSYTWTTSMQVSTELGSGHHGKIPGRRCVCSEWCRSISAGTGVDFTEGMRASDPKRLAVYFLKESFGGDAKAYQNQIPWAWCEGGLDIYAGEIGPLPRFKIPRQSVGRFWGVKGIDKAVSTVIVEANAGYRLWRVMRKVRRARSMASVREVEKVDLKTGELVIETRVKRPRIRGTAGWVAVNDGSAFGARLGEYAAELAGNRETFGPPWKRELNAENAARLDQLRRRVEVPF